MYDRSRKPLVLKKRTYSKNTVEKTPEYKIVHSTIDNNEEIPDFNILSRSINWSFEKEILGPDQKPLNFIIRAEYKDLFRPIIENIKNPKKSFYGRSICVKTFPTTNEGMLNLYEWLKINSHKFEYIYKSNAYFLPRRDKSGKKKYIQCMDRFYVDLDIEKMGIEYNEIYNSNLKTTIKHKNSSYNPEIYNEWMMLDDNGKRDFIIRYCHNAELPEPTEIQLSGGGAHVFWMLSNLLFVKRYRKLQHNIHTPKNVVDFVTRINKEIAFKLKVLNADPIPAVPTSLLRLSGTKNRKYTNNIYCRTIFTNKNNKYSSDDMKAILFPEDIRTIQDKKDASQAAYDNYHARKRFFKQMKKNKQSPLSKKIKEPPRFTYLKYAQSIIHDLNKIAQIRYGGVIPKGMRSNFSHIATMAIAGICFKNPDSLLNKTYEAIKDFMPKDYMKYKFYSDNYSAMEKMVGMAPKFSNHKAYEWKYRYSTEKIIELLHITEDEMPMLLTLVNRDIKKKRKTQNQREQRRKKGVVSREIYTQYSASNIRPWRLMGMSRKRWFAQNLQTKKEQMYALTGQEYHGKNNGEQVCADILVGKLSYSKKISLDYNMRTQGLDYKFNGYKNNIKMLFRLE